MQNNFVIKLLNGVSVGPIVVSFILLFTLNCSASNAEIKKLKIIKPGVITENIAEIDSQIFWINKIEVDLEELHQLYKIKRATDKIHQMSEAQLRSSKWGKLLQYGLNSLHVIATAAAANSLEKGEISKGFLIVTTVGFPHLLSILKAEEEAANRSKRIKNCEEYLIEARNSIDNFGSESRKLLYADNWRYNSHFEVAYNKLFATASDTLTILLKDCN